MRPDALDGQLATSVAMDWDTPLARYMSLNLRQLVT